MAQGKSKNWSDLLSHTSVYSFVWFLVGFILLIYNYNNFSLKQYADFSQNLITFTLITFTCHTITDYFTSRLNNKLWNEKKVHWFFVSIGFDQFLHFTQLLLTYQLLTK